MEALVIVSCSLSSSVKPEKLITMTRGLTHRKQETIPEVFNALATKLGTHTVKPTLSILAGSEMSNRCRVCDQHHGHHIVRDSDIVQSRQAPGYMVLIRGLCAPQIKSVTQMN